MNVGHQHACPGEVKLPTALQCVEYMVHACPGEVKLPTALLCVVYMVHACPGEFELPTALTEGNLEQRVAQTNRRT